jgi:AcrR family transcriptional regulator
VSGFNETGVDRIVAESRVTKRTLYQQFGSKEGLIEEVLRMHHERMMERVRVDILSVEGDGVARLLACSDFYRAWFALPHFSGCIFIKALNEFGSCSAKLSAVAKESKAAMHDLILTLAKEVGAREPEVLAEVLADQLQLLLEGSIIIAQTGRGAAIIDTARAMAGDLIERARR